MVSRCFMMFLGAIDYIGWDPMENPPQWIMLAVELLCHKGHPTLGGERSGFPGPFEPKAPQVVKDGKIWCSKS